MAGFSVVHRGLDAARDGTGLQANVPTVSAGSVTRTKVFQTPTGVGLRDIVSVHDAPFNAVGDGVTNDTTAWQNAINAVSSAGGGMVRGREGSTYVLGSITPKSNVTIWGYGSYFKSITSPSNVAFFSLASGAVTSFGIYGGTWQGTGAEPQARQILRVETPGTATDITIKDTYVSNWFTCVYFLANTARVKVTDNVLVNCGGDAGKQNLIDLVDRSTTPIQYAVVTGNIIVGAQVYGIAYVNTGNTAAGDRFVMFSDNIVQVNSTLGSGCIDIECATASIGDNSIFTVANNLCELASSVSGFYAINITATQANVNNVTVTGNVVKLTSVLARGIWLQGSGITCTGNDIVIPAGGGLALEVDSTRTITGITGDVTSASPTIINVAGTQTLVQNGQFVTGTGIPTGTWLVSGAGTATWTLSINATATNTGVALTAQIMYSNVNIAHNTIDVGIDPAQDIVLLKQLNYSKFADNIINYAPGSISSTTLPIRVTNCGWSQIAGNQINYAPHFGMQVQGHNIAIENNDVYNAGEASQANSVGISANNVTGGVYLVARNRVVDDRTVHRLVRGVDVSANTNALVDVLDNHLIGWTTTPINGTAGSKRDNIYTASSAVAGRATLVAGTVTVTNAEIRTADNVILSVVVAGGTRGEIQLGTITQGTSFVINSIQPGTASTLQAADTSTVYWRIDH